MQSDFKYISTYWPVLVRQVQQRDTGGLDGRNNSHHTLWKSSASQRYSNPEQIFAVQFGKTGQLWALRRRTEVMLVIFWGIIWRLIAGAHHFYQLLAIIHLKRIYKKLESTDLCIIVCASWQS